MIRVTNRTDDLLLVGDRYLFPGEGRLVPDYLFHAARSRYGAGLAASGDYPTDDDDGFDDDAADGADGLLDDDGLLESEFLSLESEFLSLDVLDGDADAADLGRMTRAELAETARLHGIVPGRMTKRELIDAIRTCE
jgi:hypothetical protein